jgi:phospholipase C
MALKDIEHIVVVMMENRSFDNLLGWLYDNQTNPLLFNIPAQPSPTFEGLQSRQSAADFLIRSDLENARGKVIQIMSWRKVCRK